MNRRGFLTGVLGLIAAPAIVRATSLMPINSSFLEFVDMMPQEWPSVAYGELSAITRKVFVPRLFVQIYERSPVLALLMDNAA